MAHDPITIESLGDNALLVRFGSLATRECFDRIRFFDQSLSALTIPGHLESVPAYTTLAIYFEPSIVSPDSFLKSILRILNDIDASNSNNQQLVIPLGESTRQPLMRSIEVPVCYGSDFGPDLDFVASSNNLTKEEVIDLHMSATYFVHMLGFLPGFPYMGGLSNRIATPRKLTPRIRVPAGSVGIAGTQTGIYPIESPGGWQIIGRTPLRLFDESKEAPSFIRAGDTVRFISISHGEFQELLTSQSSPL